MLKVDIIPCLKDNYSYVIFDINSNTVGVIDPSEFEKVDNFISKKYQKIDYIFNTHHHFDHVGGNLLLKKKYNSKIIGPKIEKDKIPGIDILIDDKDNFKFGDCNFEIISVPGHTIGHIAIYSKKNSLLFSGDTLFSLGCGRVFEGNLEQMFQSIKKLKILPKETKIYCGHEYTLNNLKFCKKYDFKNNKLIEKAEWINSRLKDKAPTLPITIKEELETNIFLRYDNSDIKNYLGMINSTDEQIFKKLRTLKDEF
tara:strand:- start:50 stop:814 length:765 start_codon:yes stop_codon:yes gene_type:complete